GDNGSRGAIVGAAAPPHGATLETWSWLPIRSRRRRRFDLNGAFSGGGGSGSNGRAWVSPGSNFGGCDDAFPDDTAGEAFDGLVLRVGPAPAENGGLLVVPAAVARPEGELSSAPAPASMAAGARGRAAVGIDGMSH
ncbi:unnamed protein product, partial [Phaeothamnion confervicola]